MSQRLKQRQKSKENNRGESSSGSSNITKTIRSEHRKSNLEPKFQEETNLNEDKLTIDKTIEEIFITEDPNLSDILKILKEIFLSQQFLSIKYDEYLLKNTMLEETCEKLKKENDSLKNEVKELKMRMDKNENVLRERNIEIHGIPYVKDERLNDTIMDIGKNFGINIKTEDIDYIYRKKNNNRERNDKPGPVIASFTRRENKERFLLSRKHRSLYARELGFENSKNQIFINEDLTKQNKDLLWKTRKAKKEKNFKYAWYKLGNIYLRKNDNTAIIKITDELDLAKL